MGGMLRIDDFVRVVNERNLGKPITARTVRHYVSKGSLSPPVGGTSSARYTDEHVKQLVGLLALKGATEKAHRGEWNDFFNDEKRSPFRISPMMPKNGIVGSMNKFDDEAVFDISSQRDVLSFSDKVLDWVRVFGFVLQWVYKRPVNDADILSFMSERKRIDVLGDALFYPAMPSDMRNRLLGMLSVYSYDMCFEYLRQRENHDFQAWYVGYYDDVVVVHFPKSIPQDDVTKMLSQLEGNVS